MSRMLIDGTELSDHDPVVRSIKTKCVDKWVLVDTETGAIYHPNSDNSDWDWGRVSDSSTLDRVSKCLNSYRRRYGIPENK